jgi:hypothetical protein
MLRLSVLVVGMLLGSGCFKEPRPKCSFLCGSAGECPESYACVPADNRCHLVEDGVPAATCEEALPADGAPGADGDPFDGASPDGAADGVPGIDTPGIDAPDIDAPDIDAPDIDAEAADADTPDA